MAFEKAPASKDLTGRERLVSNVLFSWGGQFVFIIAGFIIPRLIDHRLGQEVLGVWDFAWTLVGYFAFVQAGIAAAVNRFVAGYWASKDTEGISRVVSSATFVLAATGVLISVLTAGLAMLLPQFFGDKLGRHLQEAQWALILLGFGFAFQTALGAFNGVITGCHRWDLQNINQAGWYFVTALAMIVALWLGGGLITLAAITCAGDCLTQLSKARLAFKVCGGMQVRFSFMDWATVRELYGFGLKVLLPSVSSMLLNSTAGVLIVAHAGPGGLALFARPKSLMRHVETLVRRMTMTLIPTVSSMQAGGDMSQIRALLISAGRYSMFMVLPAAVGLTIFGGPIMALWMGEGYANDLLMAVFAWGLLLPIGQSAVLMVLTGLNAHGCAGLAESIASLAALLLTYVALGPLDLGIVGAAFAITIPLSISSGVFLPILIRRRVGIGCLEYYCAVLVRPFLLVLPATGCFLVCRWYFSSPNEALLFGAFSGGTALGIVYWMHVLPNRMKERMATVIERIKVILSIAQKASETI